MEDQSKELSELVTFLKDPKPEVVEIALKSLLPFTNSELPSYRAVLANGYPDFVKLTRSETPNVVHDAFSALINLSSHTPAPLESHLSYFVGLCLKKDYLFADLSAMILSNLTKRPAVLNSLLALPNPDPSSDIKSALDALLNVFVEGYDKKHNANACYDFLASVFADLSASSPGRKYLLEATSTTSAISQISVFSEHPNIIRRGGVASCIKNCCFEKEKQESLLLETKYNLLSRILLPLCGPEEFDADDQEKMPDEIQFLSADKKREPDSAIRQIYIEALLLLCTTFTSRNILRTKNVYRVVQVMDLAEENENIKILIDQLVNILERPESYETKDADEPKENKDADELKETQDADGFNVEEV